jgi:hypothetical protein
MGPRGFAEKRDISGAFGVPRIPARPPASNDTVAKSLNPKDKPARPTTVISTSAWPRRSFSTRFAREEKSHTATRSTLSATRPPTPFGPADPASPRNRVALGDLSSHDHRPGPSPRSRARRDDAPDSVVPPPAAPRAGPSLGTTGLSGVRTWIRSVYLSGGRQRAGLTPAFRSPFAASRPPRMPLPMSGSGAGGSGPTDAPRGERGLRHRSDL